MIFTVNSTSVLKNIYLYTSNSFIPKSAMVELINLTMVICKLHQKNRAILRIISIS